MVCSPRFVDMMYTELHEYIPATFQMLLVASPDICNEHEVADIKSPGSDSIPFSTFLESLISNTFSFTSSGGIILFSIPSKPAARHTANARYGLAAGSGHLNSTLVPAPLDAGIRISGLRFVADHAM